MTSGPLIVGIDAGNTVVKAAVYDTAGVEVAVAGRRTPQTNPGPGLAEQAAAATWDAAASTVSELLQRSDINAKHIEAVGVTGFGNGLWLVTDDGTTTRPAISSVDTRATAIVEAARRSGAADAIQEIVRSRLWAGQPAPLLLNLCESEPAVVERASALVFCKDYLRHRLTGGVLGTDRTDLSCGGLATGHTGEPAFEVFELLGVPALGRLLAADLLDPLSIGGYVTPDAAAATGLPPGIPVAVGVVDILAAALGSGVIGDGEIAVTSGTWGINAQMSSTPSTDGSILASVLTFDPERHLLVEAGATSAGNLEWFAETFLPDLDSADGRYKLCNSEVASVDVSCTPEPYIPPVVHYIPPVVHYIPHITGAIENGNARAGFYGFGREHTRAHAIRAIYQGVANEHRIQLNALGVDLSTTDRIRFSGGAARSAIWSQMFADTFNTRLEVPTASELGALGAAMIAGIAIGVFDDYRDAAKAMVRIGREYEPEPAAVEQATNQYRSYCRVRSAFLELAQADP